MICGECLFSSVSRLSDETHGQLWGGDSSVNSLSVLSCHLLCFPFALDLSSETMDRLLQLYHSAGIVSGLLQVRLSPYSTLTRTLLSLWMYE